MTTTREILSYLLPFVVTAGSYSSTIQGRVATHDEKDGATPFHHALSDADLTIQSYLEVALLAKFPNLSFFSEEQASSLNKKYFAHNAELEVLLDPIDGTRAYIDNRAAYQVIVTVHDRTSICGALIYLPRRKQAFIAVRGEGAHVLSLSDITKQLPGSRLTLTQTSGPVLTFHRPEIVEKLRSYLDIRDLTQEYEHGEGAYNSMDLLCGRAAAVIVAPSQAIDGGAISFIAQEAGAIVSDQYGRAVGSYRESPKRVLPCVLVAVTREWHERILGLIQGIQL